MKEASKKYLKTIAVLALIGASVSAYLIYLHYKPEASKICTLNDFINCDIVNKSVYATLFGIPVSVIGFIGYGVIGVSALKKVQPLLQILSLGALLFSLYLTYVELFVLQAICLFCVASQLIILGIFILSIIAWKKE